jgi:8-oxo-dGTP pyrophosphatase MutT (NUDIX family)
MLDEYESRSAEEAADLLRMRALIATGDPWSRAVPLHITGSALIVHVATRRVLLRWHDRQQAWLQVGGHADPGEIDPFAVAQREATEETGLQDLRALQPDPVQVVIVPVPAGRGEPAHEHADIRYAFATATPDLAVAESDNAKLAWLTFDEARARTSEANLRECLRRVEALL